MAHAGTPAYMAPEQIEGELPTQGPWTDLYALGCVVWELVCGNPPYVSRNRQSVLRAHLRGELPAFLPRIPVPDALETWLQRCLAADAGQRFRHAADAGWVLEGFATNPVEQTLSPTASDTWFPLDRTLDEELDLSFEDPVRTVSLRSGPPEPPPRPGPSAPSVPRSPWSVPAWGSTACAPCRWWTAMICASSSGPPCCGAASAGGPKAFC